MRLQTNHVVQWLLDRVETVKDDLSIKTIIQGDFTNLPGPEEISSWANILLIKPAYNEIDRSTTDGLFNVQYNAELYFMRQYSTDEPINAKLVEETETLAEVLFSIDEYERLPDHSPIVEALITRVDYDSDVEGLLRALDVDVTASKLYFRLTAEQ